MLEAVLWDNDGVLLDTETLFFETTREAFGRLGLNLTREIWGRQYLSEGRTSREIALSLGGDPAHVAPVLEDRNQRYRQVLSEPPATRPQVRETLAALAGSLRLALVTGSPRDQLELMHRSTGVLRFFELIVTGDDASLSKPHPALYLVALKRLNLNAGQCLAIEDSPRGLAAAREAGIPCLIVPTDLTFPLEFPRALAVVQDVSGVLKYIRHPDKLVRESCKR